MIPLIVNSTILSEDPSLSIILQRTSFFFSIRHFLTLHTKPTKQLPRFSAAPEYNILSGSGEFWFPSSSKVNPHPKIG